VDGYIDFQTAEMFVGLTRMFAIFLAITIAIEMVIAVYAYFRVSAFAEENLRALA
jgi:hypothetical protein